MASRVAFSTSARVARLLPPVARAARPSHSQRIGSAIRTFGSASSTFLRKASAPRSASTPLTRTVASSSIVAAFGTSMGTQLAPKTAPAGLELATFAGGCFWGLELAYQRLPGVKQTSVGYTQGQAESPSYNAVCTGRTGHTEAVQVAYDPKEVSYEALLDLFFDRVDPTTRDRQGNDSGSQYRSGIYYHSAEQKAAVEKAVASVNEKLQSNTWKRVLGSKVVTEVTEAGDYWVAESYHQQYLQKGGQDASKGASNRIRCYG